MGTAGTTRGGTAAAHARRPFSVTGRAACRALFGALLLAQGVRAAALDPATALTQYGHDAWQIEDGLPKNSVSSIHQTRDGYLWVSTQGGLARFDGARFTVPEDAQTGFRAGHSYGRFLEDRRGVLWIASQGGGLLRYEGGSFSAYSTKEGLPSDMVSVLCEDGTGGLWVGTFGSGLAHMARGRFTVLSSRDGLPNDAIRALARDPSGALWIGTDGGGLVKYEGGKFTATGTAQGLSNDHVSCLLMDRDGSLWVGTNEGLDRIREGRVTRFTTKDGLTNDLVLNLFQDRQGSLWVGTYGGGLNCLRDGRFAALTSRDGLTSDLIFCITEDREGSLWVGTLGGLDRLRDDKVKTFTTREGLADDGTWCVLEDRRGALWVGTHRGLDRYQGGRFVHYTTKEGLANDLVWSLFEDRQGDLWIGTRGGLNRLRDGRFTTFTAKDGLPSNQVLSLAEGGDGALWIGTDGGGLCRLQGGRFSTLTTKDGLGDNTVMCLHEDRSGGLWVGTRTRLDYLSGGKVTPQPIAAVSIHEDADGTLWFGTFGQGLYRMRDGRLTSFTAKQGLYDDVVFQILDDGAGNLWLSSNQGISRVSRAVLDEFADGRRRAIECLGFGKADGMKSTECAGGCQPTGWADRKGHLWFPTQKGLVYVDPGRITPNALRPPVYVEAVRFARKPVPLEGEHLLGPGRGELEIRYTALSFLAPKRVLFQTRLEGFDDEWSTAGTQRTVTYNHIPPGTYRFRVKACNNDGVWNEEGADFSFRLRPRFYQTLWFYTLALLALALAAYGAFVLRVARLRAKGRRLRALVEERTAQLNESNRALEERGLELERANRRLEEVNEQLHRLSYLDGLTGIANRRHFEEVFDLEWRRAVRTRLPLALVMVDIDLFKSFNDTYGHQQGDECLRRVAMALAGALERAGDLVARYGGEEFVVLLPATSAEGAARVADQLRALVEALGMLHGGGVGGRVTISMGVASVVPAEGVSAPSLLEAADHALYQAKQAGRNRVERA